VVAREPNCYRSAVSGSWSAKRLRAAATVVALLLALGACRTVPELPAALRDAPQAPRDDRPPRVAVVLGGGAARGFAHVGVLSVLEEARIPIELVVGTSVGSLVGAMYADGRNRFELEHLARDLERDDFFDFGITPALFGTGLASGDRLEEWAREHLRARRIEDLRIPYAAVATDLDTGAPVVLRSGDLARAVRASCAVPGVFEPVVQEGRLLVDGGVVSNLPVREARALGADVVIAVDVTALAGKARPGNFLEVILRAVNILANEGVEEAAREADVLVAPAVGELGLMDFDAKGKSIAAGAKAAREALPRIREALGRVRSASVRGVTSERRPPAGRRSSHVPSSTASQ
jgi:NTE family protein